MAANREILEALTSGIQSELASYFFYVEAIKKTEDPDFRSVLEELAGEEKKHFQMLEKQYDSMVKSEMWISTADILKGEGLPEIAANMADGHKELIESIKNLKTKREILDMALKLEESARDLFKKLADESDSETARKMFEHLAGFEEGHVKLVNDMIANLDD